MKKLYYFSIYLIFFSTPFESFGLIPGVSVVKIVTFFFLISAIPHLIYTRLQKSSFTKLFFGYVIYAVLSFVWSIDIEVTLSSALLTLLPTYIVIFILCNSEIDQKKLTNIIKSYSLGALTVGVVVIYEYFTKFRYLLYGYSRATALGQDQNEMSFLLVFGVVCILYLFQFNSYKLKTKFLYSIAIIVLVYAILLTGSRTGFVILAFVLFIFILVNSKGLRIFVASPIILIGFIYIFDNLSEAIASRLLQTTTQITDLKLTNREIIWSMGISSFIDSGNLLLGIGHDSFRTMMKNEYGASNAFAVHNTYLGTFIELGLVGLLLYLMILRNIIKKVIFLARNYSIYYVNFIVPLLIVMMTLGITNRRWLFLIGVIVIKIYNLRKTKHNYYAS